jgi:enamine deaminase RidA (YjgF/YER057c/UK114 family)
MALISHNPNNLFPPYRSYSHAIEVPSGARLLFISGLNGYLIDGKTIPESFEEQGHNVWRHIGTLLHEAGMDYSDLVSIRTYLSDPKYDEANVGLRVKYLGSHRPALTVICCTMLEPGWKLEVEAVAAKTQG